MSPNDAEIYAVYQYSTGLYAVCTPGLMSPQAGIPIGRILLLSSNGILGGLVSTFVDFADFCTFGTEADFSVPASKTAHQIPNNTRR